VTGPSTLTSTADRRAWWREESIRVGTDWRSVFQFHCEIVDRLRTHSSLWVSS
jgi:hypothetical protein